jgi:hypothetical protein
VFTERAKYPENDKKNILNFMRNIVFLHFLSRCARKHIRHQYQTETMKKTETVTFSLYLPNFNEFFIEELEKQFTTVFWSRQKFHNILWQFEMFFLEPWLASIFSLWHVQKLYEDTDYFDYLLWFNLLAKWLCFLQPLTLR